MPREVAIMYCEKCDALEETCCQAAAGRRVTAIALARIVDRQAGTIEELTAKLEAAKAVSAGLLAMHRIDE